MSTDYNIVFVSDGCFCTTVNQDYNMTTIFFCVIVVTISNDCIVRMYGGKESIDIYNEVICETTKINSMKPV